MPLVAEVGDVVESLKEVTVEWIIRDVFALSDKVDDFYSSPVFSFADSTWYLRLYPNGETKSSSAGSMGLYLMIGDSTPHRTVPVTFTFGINCSGVRKEKEKIERAFSDNGFGLPKFWGRSELRRELSKLLPDNVLTITCHLKYCEPKVSKVSTSSRLREISQDFREILHCGERADFTLRVADQEWPVHKVILERRCKYFQNMFRNDWVENTENEVRFDDIDEKALDSVLEFIYSGVVEDMSVENVCEIYVAAHKFLLDDLKVLSVECMKENMGVDTMGKLLLIADTYSEDDLRESIIEYCIREMDGIFESEEWQELEKNHSSLAVALLKETSKRLRPKQTKA